MNKMPTTAKQYVKTKQSIISEALRLRQEGYFQLSNTIAWQNTGPYIIGDYIAWLWLAATNNDANYYAPFAKKYLTQWFTASELAECNAYDAIKDNGHFQPVEPNNLWVSLNKACAA